MTNDSLIDALLAASPDADAGFINIGHAIAIVRQNIQQPFESNTTAAFQRLPSELQAALNYDMPMDEEHWVKLAELWNERAEISGDELDRALLGMAKQWYERLKDGCVVLSIETLKHSQHLSTPFDGDKELLGKAFKAAEDVLRGKSSDKPSEMPVNSYLHFVSLSGTDRVAVVDVEDKERVAMHSWHLDSKGYPRRSQGRESHVYLHTEIIGAAEGLLPDHANRNPLDNRRRNLRFATRGQNAVNAPKGIVGTSNYKGVSWDKDRNKWVASICVDDKRLNLGRYENEDDAARAYNTSAKKHFGDYAFLNVIMQGDASTRKDEGGASVSAHIFCNEFEACLANH